MTQATKTVREEVDAAAKLLAEAGCDEPVADATAIFSGLLRITESELEARAAEAVPEEIAETVASSIERRRLREPLEYILGHCRFRDLELLVDPRVLVPQPHTGRLVDMCLDLPRGARAHDVGTGSGAIALAIKNERPDLIVSGSDISAAAVEVARANAQRLGIDVSFSVARGLPPGQYDLVVANLPYQDEANTALELDPEFTAHQPHVAVFAGPEALTAIRAFVDAAPQGTRVAVEHAPSQTGAIGELLADAKTIHDRQSQTCFTVGMVNSQIDRLVRALA